MIIKLWMNNIEQYVKVTVEYSMKLLNFTNSMLEELSVADRPT